MSDISNLDKAPIVIEFTTQEGLRPVGVFRREREIIEKSDRALGKAMYTIDLMARNIQETIERMKAKPSNIEVEFGLKFDVELGVLLSKATNEASINVKLRWNNQKDVS
jgi:hypothetical protein